MKKTLLLIILGLLSWGCYGSATDARKAQTKSATNFFCVGDFAVDCGQRECTGYDQTWYATCGDTQYICRFNDQRSVGDHLANDMFSTNHVSSGITDAKYEGVSCKEAEEK